MPEDTRNIDLGKTLEKLLDGVNNIDGVIVSLENIAGALHSCVNVIRLEVEKLAEKLG